MKKVLSVMAVSAFVLTANAVFAGGPGPQQMEAGCPEACQQQIDDLQSSQAQQNEQLGAHGTQLEDHEGRIKALEDVWGPWYARIGVRAAWMNQEIEGDNRNQDGWDSDMGWGGAVAFGKEIGNFRAELELAMQKTDLENKGAFFPVGTGIVEREEGDLDVTTVMVNGYYELPVADAFAVYGMAGVGVAKYDADASNRYFDAATGLYLGGGSEGFSDNVFAYKLGAGVTYNFTEEMAADLGYEYLGVADTDIADSINGHNVVASFRYKF